MAKLTVYNINKEEVGSVELNKEVFEAEYKEALVHQVYVAIHNNQYIFCFFCGMLNNLSAIFSS